MKRGEQREQQELLSKAGPLLCHHVHGPDRHSVIQLSYQLISEVQEIKDLPSQRHTLINHLFIIQTHIKNKVCPYLWTDCPVVAFC